MPNSPVTGETMEKRKICGCGRGDACSNCDFNLQFELHKISQVTASDPNHVFCRQATIMLDALKRRLSEAMPHV